jgi:hypothetical protein
MTVPTRTFNGRDLVLIAGLLAVTLWRLLPAVNTTAFHRDEARWIGNSAILREWRNPFGIRWQDEGYENRYGTGDESNRRRNQAPLAMYVIGLGLLVQGEGLTTIGYWIMTQDTDWNTEMGNMPSASELTAGRRTSVALAVLTVIALYVLGTMLTNRVGGVVAAVLYGMHPLVQTTSTRAWSDPLLVLCIVSAALAAVWLVDRPTWQRAGVLGVVLGLGAAAKLSPLPLAVALGGAGLGLWVAGAVAPTLVSDRLRQFGLRLGVVPIAAVLTFVAIYPYLWRNPVTHLYQIYAYRAQSFDEQSVNSPDAAVPSRGDAFRRIGYELGDRFSTSGLIVEELEGWLGRDLPASLAYLDLVVAVLGLLILVAMVVRFGLLSPAAAVSAVVGGQALLILLTMEVEYARYMLPVVLLVAILAGIVAGTAWEWVLAEWHDRDSGTRGPAIHMAVTTEKATGVGDNVAELSSHAIAG